MATAGREEPPVSNKEFTGLLDQHLERIYYGDFLNVGMRRNDNTGWAVERVVKGPDGLPQLEDPSTYERMTMQLDQELRVKVVPS